MSTDDSYLSNQHATAALKELRATLAGEIAHYQAALVRKTTALHHVDGVLALIAPDFEPSSLPARRVAPDDPFPLPHVTRSVLTTLRRHGTPMHVSEVAEAIAKEMGYPKEAGPSLTARIRYALRNLANDGRKRVVKIGNRRDVQWSLAKPS